MQMLLDLVASTSCLSCGRGSDGELCAGCADDIVVIRPPLCARCGAPGSSNPCACRGLRGFARARSLVAFAEPARALTLSLKRRGRRSTAHAVGRLLADLAIASGCHTGTEAITFVPAGRSARLRGFDHAELIALSIADALDAPFAPVLTRASEGPRQADVPYVGRRANVSGRFRSKRVRGGVVLVDDVFTTGATAEACSIALLDAGADTVNVVTWARTLRRATT